MNTVELVKQKWPRAVAKHFSVSNDWEIYANEDIDTALVLGSGRSCPSTFEQDLIDFKSTEDAAWLDALINISALEKFRDLVREIVSANGLQALLSEAQLEAFIRDTARKFYDAQVPYDFRTVAKRMRTQDNACTADPIFIVYEKERIYGLDTSYADDKIVWLDVYGDYGEADDRKKRALDRYYRMYHQDPEGWTRTGYTDRDRFVTACFTRVAAEEYIKRDGHNLKRPHIYVEHINRRNWEMKSFRDFLEAL